MGNQLTTKPPTTKPQTTGPVTTEQDLIMNMLTTEQDQWTLRELETFFLAAWWPHKGAGGLFQTREPPKNTGGLAGAFPEYTQRYYFQITPLPPI